MCRYTDANRLMLHRHMSILSFYNLPIQVIYFKQFLKIIEGHWN